MIYNRTEAASRLLYDIQQWCARTGTPQNSIGHVLFMHPGFVGLLCKRLTVTEEKEAVVRAFMAEHSEGWRGVLPLTHANGTRPRGSQITKSEAFQRCRDLPRVDRDPCPRCGVRRDIGCHHSRAPVGMMFS